jgi:hypothetical protein
VGDLRFGVSGLKPRPPRNPGAAAKIPFSRRPNANNACLKFNRPFEKCLRMENWPMRDSTPLLKRFLNKVVHDVLPAALASVIGGFVFTHFHLGLFANPPQLAAAQVSPASAEMMQVLRDEHGLIVDFLNAERAKEEKQLAADQSAARQAVDPRPAAATAVHHSATVALAAKLSARRDRVPVTGSAPPLVIAQAPPDDGKVTIPHAENALMAKTVGIKDHVVAVTQRVVSAIGGIPSWIGSIGDRIGGEELSPRPPANLVSAS